MSCSLFVNRNRLAVAALVVALSALSWLDGATAANALSIEKETGAATGFASPQLRSGDVLRIVVPGESAFAKPFQVDAEGMIFLPEVGGLSVGGATLDDARGLIQSELGRVYKDLSRFDVRLVERRLLLQVLGFVRQPGAGDLDDGANVQTAIEAAGGVRQGAQLDRFQLRRGDEVVRFDYKKYLDSGDLSILPPLAPGDTVFVPASPLIGNVQVEFDARTLTSAGDGADDGSDVRVFGEVINPGSFAFNDGNTIVDVLMRAGGVTRYAGVEKIRVINGAEPELFDLKAFLDTGDRQLLPTIAPGAVVYVPISVDEV